MPKVKESFILKALISNSHKYFGLKFRTFNSPVERSQIAKLPYSSNSHCYVCNQVIKGGVGGVRNHMKGNEHHENMKKLRKGMIIDDVLKLRVEKSILGFEYLAELAHAPQNEHAYICVLCRVYESEPKILEHFSSCQHTQKYLEKHFPQTLNKIQEHLEGYNESIKEEFLKTTCAIIAEHGHLYSTLLPTVCFYKEFKLNPNDVYGLIESKLHLRETEMILMKVLERLDEFTKTVSDDLILIEPEIPKIDLCDDEGSSDTLDEYLDSTANSLEDHHSEPDPLTNAEIEMLMGNFEKLTSDEQKSLLKLLFHIKKTDKDRFKLLKSPFSSA